MKWSIFLAVVLCCIFGLPFREHDTQKLLPIQTVQILRSEQGIRLISEVGSGEGSTWDEAVEDLKSSAAGHVFFDTAENVVFCGYGLSEEVLAGGQLRPAARVYFAKEPVEAEGLSAWLSAHPSGLSLADLQARAAVGRSVTNK